MNSFRCPHCGLLNFADAVECKRCRNSVDAVQQPPHGYAPQDFAGAYQFQPPAVLNQPNKNGKALGVGAFILFFLLAGFAARTILPQMFGTRVEDKIVRLCSEMNKKMPITVDAETRLDNVSPLPGKSFAYNYTLVNMAQENLDVAAIKAEMTPYITNRALSVKEVQPIFDDGVTVVYKYFDKNGKYLFEIPVKR